MASSMRDPANCRPGTTLSSPRKRGPIFQGWLLWVPAFAGTTAMWLGLSFGAYGQGTQGFYKGKQLHMIVGYEAGNDYDIGARVLAKYLPRHLPGQPTIIVQNMPQAQSIVAANFLYVRAPRDGTMLGSISRNFPSQAVLGQANIEADPRRLIWLGATSFPGRICVAASASVVKTPADLFTHELIVGAVGAGSSTSILP